VRDSKEKEIRIFIIPTKHGIQKRILINGVKEEPVSSHVNISSVEGSQSHSNRWNINILQRNKKGVIS
jgi:hypothetical protein